MTLITHQLFCLACHEPRPCERQADDDTRRRCTVCGWRSQGWQETPTRHKCMHLECKRDAFVDKRDYYCTECFAQWAKDEVFVADTCPSCLSAAADEAPLDARDARIAELEREVDALEAECSRQRDARKVAEREVERRIIENNPSVRYDEVEPLAHFLDQCAADVVAALRAELERIERELAKECDSNGQTFDLVAMVNVVRTVRGEGEP